MKRSICFAIAVTILIIRPAFSAVWGTETDTPVTKYVKVKKVMKTNPVAEEKKENESKKKIDIKSAEKYKTQYCEYSFINFKEKFLSTRTSVNIFKRFGFDKENIEKEKAPSFEEFDKYLVDIKLAKEKQKRNEVKREKISRGEILNREKSRSQRTLAKRPKKKTFKELYKACDKYWDKDEMEEVNEEETEKITCIGDEYFKCHYKDTLAKVSTDAKNSTIKEEADFFGDCVECNK